MRNVKELETKNGMFLFFFFFFVSTLIFLKKKKLGGFKETI